LTKVRFFLFKTNSTRSNHICSFCTPGNKIR